MNQPFGSEIRQSLAEAASRACGAALSAGSVRIPARHALASLRLPEGAFLKSEAQGVLFGVPLLKEARLANGWLLFDFSGELFDALALQAVRRLPPVSNPLESHAVNRLLALSRHGGDGCPRVPSMQKALFLCAFSSESAAARQRAEHAVETMFHPVPPGERPALMKTCGMLGEACARLLASSPEDGIR